VTRTAVRTRSEHLAKIRGIRRFPPVHICPAISEFCGPLPDARTLSHGGNPGSNPGSGTDTKALQKPAESRASYGGSGIPSELRLEHGNRGRAEARGAPYRSDRTSAVCRGYASATRSAWRASARYLTWSSGTSTRTPRIAPGRRISHTSGRWRAGLFLAHVEDPLSRRIVGWEMQDHMRTELVISALEMRSRSASPSLGASNSPIRARSPVNGGAVRRAARPGRNHAVDGQQG
jgi:hypothetical protein